MILSLTGFMGSGKSTVGKALAARLDCPFTDLDAVVEQRTGKRIPQIFSEEGESRFRSLEADALEDVICSYEGGMLVLSLGGGTLKEERSAFLVRHATVCVYLKASPETLAARLAGTESRRPLLRSADLSLAETVSRLLEEREPVYASAATHTVRTDGLTVGEVVTRILDLLPPSAPPGLQQEKRYNSE